MLEELGQLQDEIASLKNQVNEQIERLAVKVGRAIELTSAAESERLKSVEPDLPAPESISAKLAKVSEKVKASETQNPEPVSPVVNSCDAEITKSYHQFTAKRTQYKRRRKIKPILGIKNKNRVF